MATLEPVAVSLPGSHPTPISGGSWPAAGPAPRPSAATPPRLRVGFGTAATALGAGALCSQPPPGRDLDPQPGSDREVIERALTGEVDLGVVAGPLAVQDLQRGLRHELLAVELFALAVRADAPAHDLSLEQIKQLLRGATRDWRELGLPPQPVVLAAPADLELRARAARVWVPGDPIGTTAVDAPDDTGVLALVRADPAAVGLVRLGALQGAADVRALSIDGVLPSLAAYLAGTYPYGTPLLAVHGTALGEPVARWLARGRDDAPPFANAMLTPLR
jgi:hypothetical protein